MPAEGHFRQVTFPGPERLPGKLSKIFPVELDGVVDVTEGRDLTAVLWRSCDHALAQFGTVMPLRTGPVHIISHGRYVAFQMTEVDIPRNLFADILRLITELRPSPAAVSTWRLINFRPTKNQGASGCTLVGTVSIRDLSSRPATAQPARPHVEMPKHRLPDGGLTSKPGKPALVSPLEAPL